MDQTKEPQRDANGERLEFHYIKSSGFRVIHVDGAHGGVSPRQKIQMAVFSERSPIPQFTAHQVTQEGSGLKVGKEIQGAKISKRGVVREVEAELLMDLETAEAIRTWLDESIQLARKLRGQNA